MAIPAANTLYGLAIDLIAQVRGGNPSTDDEPLQPIQICQWLRRAASALLLEKVRQSEADDVPLDQDWFIPVTIPLIEVDNLAPAYSIREYRANLPSLPLTRDGMQLVQDVSIGEVRIPVTLVNHYPQLASTARGWGRLPSPKPAALLRGLVWTVCLPEYLWDVPVINLGYAPSDPLAGVGDEDVLPLPLSWQEAMVDRVTRGPLYFTLHGEPDRVNDASPGPTPNAQPTQTQQ